MKPYIYIYIERENCDDKQNQTVYICYGTYRINEYIDGLVQERRNSIANELELRLSCTNPSLYMYMH